MTGQRGEVIKQEETGTQSLFWLGNGVGKVIVFCLLCLLNLSEFSPIPDSGLLLLRPTRTCTTQGTI